MQIDPAIAAALAANPSVLPADPSRLEVAALRRDYEASARRGALPYPAGMRVSDHVVPGAGIAVRVYEPAGLPARGRAGLLYLHGGGWVIGSIASHDPITAALAEAAGLVVASVDYRLAPEHPFPVPIEDTESAAEWLLGALDRFGLDAGRLGIAGDSAGGNLAALYNTRRTQAGRATPFSAQCLIYPALDSGLDTPSFRENANAPVLSAAITHWFLDHYMAPAYRRDPQAVPMLAPSLAGQPATYIATAGHDPLRDEGLAYGVRLAAAGVPVVLRHAPDMVHGFFRMRAVSERAQAEFLAAAHWLRDTLAS